MPRLLVLKPCEVVRALELLGFVEVRQRRAHRYFCHSDGRGTTVPFHRAAASLVRQIIKASRKRSSSTRFDVGTHNPWVEAMPSQAVSWVKNGQKGQGSTERYPK